MATKTILVAAPAPSGFLWAEAALAAEASVVEALVEADSADSAVEDLAAEALLVVGKLQLDPLREWRCVLCYFATADSASSREKVLPPLDNITGTPLTSSNRQFPEEHLKRQQYVRTHHRNKKRIHFPKGESRPQQRQPNVE